MTEKELELLAEELMRLSPEEFDLRTRNHLSVDKEILEIYCKEYSRRGLEPPSSEMMDH